jgi:hypothetical protein
MVLHNKAFSLRQWMRRISGGFSLCIMLWSLTGCTSAKYKMADEDTPPPVPLNLIAQTESVEASLNTVIIYGGPGSWKREAYWDEYVLSVANRSAHPVVLASAEITDFQGTPVMPGEEPWELQEQSKAWVENYNSGTAGVVVGVGTASVMTGAFMGGVALATGGTGFVSGAALASVAAPAAAIVALPVIGIGTILVNIEAKHEIEDEFQGRRLPLPLFIRPGQTVEGSLFFRITAGPKRLNLLFSGNDPGFELPIELTPLLGLHLEQKPMSEQSAEKE